MNSFLLQFEEENVQERKKLCSRFVVQFLERECVFSLDFMSFGPLVLDRARSKVDLRDEGYAWTPIWWSSDNSKR